MKLQSIAATLLWGVGVMSLPCADAHGYKDIGALRLFLMLCAFLLALFGSAVKTLCFPK